MRVTCKTPDIKKAALLRQLFLILERLVTQQIALRNILL